MNTSPWWFCRKILWVSKCCGLQNLFQWSKWKFRHHERGVRWREMTGEMLSSIKQNQQDNCHVLRVTFGFMIKWVKLKGKEKLIFGSIKQDQQGNCHILRVTFAYMTLWVMLKEMDRQIHGSIKQDQQDSGHVLCVTFAYMILWVKQIGKDRQIVGCIK